MAPAKLHPKLVSFSSGPVTARAAPPCRWNRKGSAEPVLVTLSTVAARQTPAPQEQRKITANGDSYVRSVA